MRSTPTNITIRVAATFIGILAMPAAALAAHPLELRLDSAESFSQSFTVIADLEDGTYVQIQLGISNLGFGDGKGVCRVLVVEPGQKPWTAAEKVDRDEWLFTTKPVPQLRIGTCTAWSGRFLQINTLLDSGVVRLKLESRLSALRPTGSPLESGDDFYDYEILAPFGRAEVELVLPGRKPRLLKGFGYADRSRGTMLPKKQARLWVRFRALATKDALLILGRFPSGGGKPIAWVWKQAEATPQILADFSAEPHGSNHWIITSGGMRIESRRLLYRYAPAEQYGFLGVMARLLVGNPITRTYRAELTMPGLEQPLSGILEISNVE